MQRRSAAMSAASAQRWRATRYRDRDTGKQVQRWQHLDYAVQAFVTNNWQFDAEDIVADYDGRAEIFIVKSPSASVIDRLRRSRELTLVCSRKWVHGVAGRAR
jgi:hypothetical protein